MIEPRKIVATLGALACVALAPLEHASAWVEAHVEADDVKVVVDRTGDARIEHRITLRVAGGPLRSFDLRGVDADATPDNDSFVIPEKEASRGSIGSAVQVIAERLPPDPKPRDDGAPAPTVLRLRFDREKGLGRGVYVLSVKYTTHLETRFDASGGPLAHVTWKSPIWEDGLDSARVTFDLPAAPTEPHSEDLADAEAQASGHAPLVLSTVRRGTNRDQIELVRPYAPKGEGFAWAIRADARALRPLVAAAPTAPKPRGVDDAPRELGLPRSLGLALAGLVFVAYSAVVALKSRETEDEARAAGATARPFVPIPSALRAALAGLLLVAGIFVELVLARATAGAALVLGATVLAAHRSPLLPRPGLRGRGRWLPMTEAAAFVDAKPAPGGWFDASTRAGKVLLTLLLGGLFGVVAWLFPTSPYRAELLAFDAAALLAIFGTGRRAELPPNPATAPAGFLRDVARRVRKALPEGTVRVLGRVRVPEGEREADELRLVVLPRSAEPGFGAIEVGVAYASGTGGFIGFPEVLLRVTEGSPCDARIDRVARLGHASRGRKADERVVLLTPRLPTARMTAGIVAGVVRAVLRSSKDVARPRGTQTSARAVPTRAA